MSAQSDMIAAVNAAETAAVALAAAYTDYLAAYRVAANHVYAAGTAERAVQDMQDLEHAVGPERVAQFAAARLLALGAVRIIEQPGTIVPAGPEWASWLIAQIEHAVPAAAAAA